MSSNFDKKTCCNQKPVEAGNMQSLSKEHNKISV